MKHNRIEPIAPADASPPRGAGGPHDIINMMEQGVLVWSAAGLCELHNTRVFELMEIGPGDLAVGTPRASFRERAVLRGEISPEDQRRSQEMFALHQPYSFDSTLPSGRVVQTMARPSREGGYVVTFTDVTEARKAAAELIRAKSAAEAAEVRAREVLEQERARQSEARLLSQLDEWLQSCKSLDELYQIVTSFMAKLLPGSKGELYIYSNSRDVLDGTCKWGTKDLHETISADSCWALRRGRSYEYEVDGLCFLCDHVAGHNHQVAVSEYVCVPIVAHGDTVGMLHIRFESGADATFASGREACQFAMRCGEHISMAIANVKLRDELRDQSIRDPLTGLYNRRYLLEALRREVAISDRRNGRFGVISFDADRFKTFNDNHGHDAGDLVLRGIAAKMEEVMFAGEVCCRFGGEEFVVLVPAADLDETAALAERLRAAVAALQLRFLDRTLPAVTISVGCAAYPAAGATSEDLLRVADKALYAAKQAGRNCVRTTADL